MSSIIEKNIQGEVVIQAQCNICDNFHKGKVSCDAFNKIPTEILTNEFKHTKKFPGDNGIQFEKIGG